MTVMGVQTKAEFHVGQRLSYDNDLCTVRYYGPVEGAAQGPWLGVEWDNVTRGKHTGKSYFTTLSSSPTSASFIRPSRPQDLSRSFLQALRHKYVSVNNGLQANEASEIAADPRKDAPIEISGKIVEEVGFDRIRQQQGLLHHLRIVLLDGLCLRALTLDISFPNATAAAQEAVAQTCPNIAELDLGWNLIETWTEIAEICRPLKKLRILKAGGLRFRAFELPPQIAEHRPFKQIEELHLTDNLLLPEQIFLLLSSSTVISPSFQHLKTLSLSQNNLSSFYELPASSSSFQIPSLVNLVLENNLFTSLEPLIAIFQVFPSLKSVSLQGNRIANLGSDGTRPLHGLETLNLSHNLIANYKFIDGLPAVFPDLLSLRISNNPFFSGITAAGALAADPPRNKNPNLRDPGHVARSHINPTTRTDTSYSLTLARIPNLKTLNYSTITTRDREEGEIYYLATAERDLATNLASASGSDSKDVATLATFTSKYPRYEALCTKYERVSILAKTSKAPSSTTEEGRYAPGTLGARRVTVHFHISPPPPPPATMNPPSSTEPTQPSQPARTWTRALPRTTSIYSLKGLLTRHFGLPPLGFKLIYESEELDPVREDPGGGAQTDWSDWGDWCLDHDGCREKALKSSGQRWVRREVEIAGGTREWGNYLEDGVRRVSVRVEPEDEDWVAEGRRIRAMYC